MTSGPPTFGDFLGLASSKLLGARAPADTVTPGRDAAEVSDGILHVVTVLTRFTADRTKMIGRLPDPQLAALSTWDRAGLQVHDLLTSATAALRPSGPHAPGGDGEARSRPAGQLHSAARALGAGRDLLQSHFRPDRSGARVGNSGWALAICSPAVASAQLTEIASLARQAAAAGEASLRGGYPLPDAGDRLATTCQLLSQAASSVDEANRSEPVTQAERDLLRAIPANVMPSRPLVAGPESVPALCQAVITTAQRASHAAWAAAELDPQSTAISIASWHRIAAAGMVASHHCQILCATLADRRSGDLSHPQDAHMAEVAADAGGARDAWLDVAREYQEITTDIRDHMSPAAVEAAELALWTGRLAYADPAWNLASGPSHPARPAEALAPRQADMPEVIGAIHHASEAVAQLAKANLEQARSAVRGQRILVPTRSLPERYDIPSPYTPAPASYHTSLIMCCEDTGGAARRLADAVAEIAIETSARSRPLATANDAVRRMGEYQAGGAPIVGTPRGRDAQLEMSGPVESELRSLGVTSPRTLWRAVALDRASRQLVADASPVRARRAGFRAVAREQAVSDGLQAEP